MGRFTKFIKKKQIGDAMKQTKSLKEETMAFEPTQPAYSGNGVAIWEAKDKNGKAYLKVKVLGGATINCFKVEPKKEGD